MKQLDERLLLNLGFIKDGTLNLSPDFYYKKNKIYVAINLKETSPTKHCGIEIIEEGNKNNNFAIKLYSSKKCTVPLYLEQLSIMNRLLTCTGLPIDDELLKRNGYNFYGTYYKYINKQISCYVEMNNKPAIISYNSVYVIKMNNIKISCSHLDLIYKLLGEENKKIW